MNNRTILHEIELTIIIITFSVVYFYGGYLFNSGDRHAYISLNPDIDLTRNTYSYFYLLSVSSISTHTKPSNRS